MEKDTPTTLTNIPPGVVAEVKIIDTTSKIRNILISDLMGPPLDGFEVMPEMPSWSFLIESATTGRKALFDLGVPKNWEQLAPEVLKYNRAHGWEVEVDKDTAEILTEHGYRLEDIGSIIWSHWYWDHLGDPSTFPPSTELVVGPGFKANFMPGYPLNPKAPTRESDFQGRFVRELTFEEGEDHPVLSIGDFKAIDFFGDGSFYLLDTPGHAVGHLCGLARTSTAGESKDGSNTFISWVETSAIMEERSGPRNIYRYQHSRKHHTESLNISTQVQALTQA